MAKTESLTPSLLARLVAEGFGTLLLVGGVIGTALFTSGATGPLGPALAVGLAVIAGAYSVGYISGGHFNPAVTVGLAMARRFAWKDVLPYVGAQVAGGAIATSIIAFISADGPEGANFGVFHEGGFASNGFGDHSPAGYGLGSVIIVELVLTALFLFVILGATASRAAAGFAPIAIGLALTMFHLASIPVSNTSLNPARSIATAIYGGGDALLQLWVFLVVPVAGAAIAGATWALLFDGRLETAKAVKSA